MNNTGGDSLATVDTFKHENALESSSP
jgi:hypothetical protein